MSSKIGIIDVFAGPGGLGEGFSSFAASDGACPFKIVVSAEMERTAHASLRLRAFLRLLREKEGAMPKAYACFMESLASGQRTDPEDHFSTGPLRSLWAAACSESLNLTLGNPDHDRHLYERIAAAKRKFNRLVLIGGPPCQAYSLVGRARQRNVPGFKSKGDKKHFLYLEYLQILADYSPDVFIMENVKGILTSKVGGDSMFDRIHSDLANPRRAVGRPRFSGGDEYVLLPIHVPNGGSRDPDEVANTPAGFIIKCERHGLPQARHRVIIMGVRADLAHRAIDAPGLVESAGMSIQKALSGLPKLRSGLSRVQDDALSWISEVEHQRNHVIAKVKNSLPNVAELLREVRFDRRLERSAIGYTKRAGGFAKQLMSTLPFVTSHETRTHMSSDLGRYLFVSAFGAKEGRSPNSADFPSALAPDHINWASGAFADRFRVQIKKRPASTVTSHLSKDGHAFIHWDVEQCRSLTVREAARLQTFPDDYVFLGNKTEQFVQVGNAVPPMIAKQIAAVVWSIFDGDRRHRV